jgi:hypothetical protein
VKPNRNRSRELDSQHVHRPKRACPHIAQEVRELGNVELQAELTRTLTGWARGNALGTSERGGGTAVRGSESAPSSLRGAGGNR